VLSNILENSQQHKNVKYTREKNGTMVLYMLKRRNVYYTILIRKGVKRGVIYSIFCFSKLTLASFLEEKIAPILCYSPVLV